VMEGDGGRATQEAVGCVSQGFKGVGRGVVRRP